MGQGDEEMIGIGSINMKLYFHTYQSPQATSGFLNMLPQLADCTNKLCGPQEMFTFQCLCMWPQDLWARNYPPPLRVMDSRQSPSELNQGLASTPGQGVFTFPDWKDLVITLETVTVVYFLFFPFVFQMYHCWWEKNFLLDCN